MTELRLVDQARLRPTIFLPLVHPVPLDYRHAFLRGASRGIGVLDGVITVTAPDVDALSGAPAGIGSVAGLPTLEARLAAVAAGSGSSAARAILSLAIAGLAQGAGAVSGALSAVLGASGAAPGVGGAVGDVQLAALLGAVAAGVGAISGSAAPSGALTGSLDGVGAMTGAVQASLQESASAGGLGAVAGDVQAALGESGVAIGVGTAAAATLAALAVLGSGQGVGAAAAAIQAVLSVAGITAGAGAASAAVSALAAEAGAAAGAGTAAGTPTLTSGTARVFDATSGARPSGWSFSRGSAATYFNSSGVFSSASSNTERLDYLYNGSTWVLGGLLYEPSAQNYLLQSNNFTNGVWGTSHVTPTLNTSSSPDGTTDASTLTHGGGAAQFYQDVTAAAGSYAMSVFVKAGTGATWVYLQLSDGSNGYRQWFRLSDGTLGTLSTIGSGQAGGMAEVRDCGNGWFRLKLSATTIPGTIKEWLVGHSRADAVATGTLGDTVLIYQADLTDGSIPTSAIQTTTAAVTRSADSASFTLSASTLTFTFDDGSTQLVSGLTSGATYTIPTSLNRSRILYIDAA